MGQAGHFTQLATISGARRTTPRRMLFSGDGTLTLHGSPAPRATIARAALGALSIGEVCSTGHDVVVNEHVSATFLTPLRGRIRSTTADGFAASVGAGGAMFFSPGRRLTRVEAAEDAAFVGVPIIIPEGELRDVAMELGSRPTGATRFALTSDGPGAVPLREIALLVEALYSELARGSARLGQMRSRDSWARLITEKLVELLDAAGHLALPDARDAAAADRHVRIALEYMRAHLADIATIAEVAAACGVGVRTLESAFRDVWGAPPSAALVEFRLIEARRLLGRGSSPATVSEIAHAVGFAHLGRFAAAYRRRFGEPPSRTLRRR